MLRAPVRAMQTIRRLTSTATVADLEASGSLLRISRANPRATESPLVVHSEMEIGEAAMHLAANSLTFAMVADGPGEPVRGMLSERNLLRFVTEAGDIAAFAGLKPTESARQTVGKWMCPREEMPWVRLDTPLAHAVGLSKHRVWRHLPVLDHWGQLHGVLDLRDAVTSVAGSDGKSYYAGSSAADLLATKRRQSLLGAAGAAAAETGAERGAGWRAQLEQYLLEHASRHTCPMIASVEAAARQMQRERLSFLVVLETAGGAAAAAGETKPRANRVAGLVTERSFLHIVSEWAHGKRTLDVTTCEAVGEAEASAAPPRADGVGGVSAIMTPLDQVLHVSLSDPATKCIDLFFTKNATHLPVIDRGHLSGIISVSDLLRPLLDASADEQAA